MPRRKRVPLPREVAFNYVNWKKKRRRRYVIPVRVWYGHTAFHPDDQWLLHALDLEVDDTRDFAIKGIQGRLPPPIMEMLEIAKQALTERSLTELAQGEANG